MPAKEVSLNELKVTGAAGAVLHKSLVSNKDYTGAAQAVPPDVVGEAALSTIKVLKSEKETETWIMINASGIVTTPSEYKGRFVYPGFTYGASTLADHEKVDDTVKGLIRFLKNLGIPEAQVEAVKAAKPSDFVYAAVKTIEANCGKNAAHFKFATQKQKKDPTRTVCYANGPTALGGSAPLVVEHPKGTPQLDEVWSYSGVDCHVRGVNPTPNAETVNLEPVDGSAPFENVPWFSPEGDPQIAYVRG